MNPQQLNNYASNISAQLVGASSLAEAGQWINTPKRNAQRQTEAKKPNATMSNAEIDQVFSADASPSAPSKKVIQNPFMNAGISSVLQNKKGTNTPEYLFKN